MNIEKIIRPETDLEKTIVRNKEFQKGASWGKPRNGHPEGIVAYHIREVLDNVDKYSSSENREALRLIALIHDTFKHKVDTSKSRSGENHHAMIARRFAEEFITDTSILDIIELHDEAYNAYCKGSRDRNWDKANFRLGTLLYRLRENLDLFTIFYKCDNETGDKRQDNYTWFINNNK
jgi:hypothetical protein